MNLDGMFLGQMCCGGGLGGVRWGLLCAHGRITRILMPGPE
jgi:hypothetical protein